MIRPQATSVVDLDAGFLEMPDVSDRMAEVAGIFVVGMDDMGQKVDFDPGHAGCLETITQRYLRTAPSSQSVDLMATALGAYLGEVIVRRGAGSWVYNRDVATVGLRLLSGALCFPQRVAEDHLLQRPRPSLVGFLRACLGAATLVECRE